MHTNAFPLLVLDAKFLEVVVRNSSFNDMAETFLNTEKHERRCKTKLNPWIFKGMKCT